MQTIDIRTTQNVIIEYELASLRERILAFILDVLIVGGMYLVLVLIINSFLQNTINSSGLLANLVYGLLPIGGFVFYQLLSEILADGQSWGKKAMRIKVVRLDGQEPSLSDYLLRAVFHLVDTFSSLGVIATLLISSSEKNQRLGDLTASTTVIRLQHDMQFELEDILKIDSLADYQPHYPQVKQLSEQDMLFIKNALKRYREYENEAHQKVIVALADRLQKLLGLDMPPANKIEFLKTLIRDYIVLTR